MSPPVERDVPDARTAVAIGALATTIEREDGAPPLSDQVHTKVQSPDVAHYVVRQGDAVVAYGQRAGVELEVAGAVEPVALVLDAALADAGESLLVWTHGRRSRLAPVFEHRGFERVRDLYQLRRPLDDAHPLPDDPPVADGIVVRPFVPGQDDAAWLALNAAAFAAHPEQGRETEADLRARMAEPWFDPAGFLLAERGGELLGFHWTKIHEDGAGEVYVLGVAPAAQGLGLGRGLLVRGLRHLHEAGCPYVLLYVDGDNPGAVRLYEREGFTRHDLDQQWRAAPPTPGP